MIKLSNILSEIRVEPRPKFPQPISYPKNKLGVFIKNNILKIKNEIDEEWNNEFNEYVDLNKEWRIIDYEYGEGYNIENTLPGICTSIYITDDMEEELEGDGPVSDGYEININGKTLQYQLIGC